MSLNPVEKLHREHTNMGRVLALIRLQLDQVARYAELDFTLLANSFYYMRKYPSVVHHPKEDLLFERLLQLGAPLEEEIGQLLRQHEEIYALEDQLIELALAAQDSERNGASRLLELGRMYLLTHFQHMQTEEGTVFPMALRRLKPRDWKRIHAQFEHIDDPLFGPKVDERYHHLYDFLIRSAAEEGYGVNLMNASRPSTERTGEIRKPR